MRLSKAICKTKNFFRKTLRTFKCFLIGEYQKLPQTPTLNPLCCSKNRSFKIHELDQYYEEYSNQMASHHDRVNKGEKKSLMSLQELMKEEDASCETFEKQTKQPLVKNKQWEIVNEEQAYRRNKDQMGRVNRELWETENKDRRENGSKLQREGVKKERVERGEKEKARGVPKKAKAETSSQKADIGNCVLAKKMKELEKREGGDINQVLDIEEVLHYYSRLKSPVYLDIVNKFFRDVSSDFFSPQASVKATDSWERGGSVKL